MSFIVNRSAYKRDNIICEFDEDSWNESSTEGRSCEDINFKRFSFSKIFSL